MTHAEQLVEWLRSARAAIARGLWLSDRPWQRVPMDIPNSAFGPGSRRQFSDYFRGQSSVTARCIDDVTAWLATCEYATDLEQFNEPDVWQDPCAFERRQRGDCEDFALWTWRKLIEIGIEAEFFVGRLVCGDASIDRQHAWVVYRQHGDAYLFEPAAHDRQRMIQPWSIVKDRYVPHFAIDHRLVTSAFVGCILDSHRSAPAT